MPAKPPQRACVDCGRPVRPSWAEVVRCAPGKGCRKGEPPPPSSQTGRIPF